MVVIDPRSDLRSVSALSHAISAMQYFDDIDRALRATTLGDLTAIASIVSARHGFNHAAYAVRLRGQPGSDRRNYYNFSDFAPEWGKTYDILCNDRIAERDARVLHVRAGMPSTAWNVEGRVGFTETTIGQLASSILRSAGEHGITSGITVPIGAPGVNWSFMTFTTDGTKDLRDLLPTLPSLTYFASCLHVAMARLQRWDDKRPDLSERELEVLHWAAVGKSSWEISMILGISERTVNFHLYQAAHKLNVRGRRAACARATALGLIHP